MFCDACEYRAFVGNSNVCGYFLHGGETVYIDNTVSEWCPKKGEIKMTECRGENTVATTLKICCDVRQNKCEYAKKVVSDNFNIVLCTKDSGEKTMNETDVKSKLIKLSAEMAFGTNMPSKYYEDWAWPKGMQVTSWRLVHDASARSQEQCRLWAIALSDIARGIIKEKKP